MLQEWFAKGA